MADDAEDEDTRKYAPLGRYLAALPPAQAGVRLTFADVERIIDAPLPPSATEHHHQWWANQSRGSRAPHWDAAGFKVDGVDLARRIVRFTRKTAGERPPRALSLQDVVTELNALSPAYDVGALPQWRKDHRNLTRAPSATMFFSTVDPTRDWVFHAGGLTELQFNVGFELVDGERTFRHGVAFSLQPTREIPDIAPLVPKIERFNEYLRIYPDALEGFSMWHWHKDRRSDNYGVGLVPDALVIRDTFIFIGALQPANAVDIDRILEDFDRLLPLYQYVEGEESFPKQTETAETGFRWTPGNKAKAPRTSYERSAFSVDKALRHNIVQAALFEHLKSIHGDDASGEQYFGNGTYVDVAVREGDKYTYYELKTGLSARSCIREALGQLMEYSFWPGAQPAHKLIVVGEPPYDNEAKAYIAKLRKDFGLPLEYRRFDMKARKFV